MVRGARDLRGPGLSDQPRFSLTKVASSSGSATDPSSSCLMDFFGRPRFLGGSADTGTGVATILPSRLSSLALDSMDRRVIRVLFFVSGSGCGSVTATSISIDGAVFLGLPRPRLGASTGASSPFSDTDTMPRPDARTPEAFASSFCRESGCEIKHQR